VIEREPAGKSPGVLASLGGLGAAALGILQTRLQLLANELEEQGLHALQLVVLAAAGLFCAAAGMVLLTAWVVIALWEHYRLLTVACLALVYFAGAALALRALKTRIAERPKLFAASLAELERDRELLRP